MKRLRDWIDWKIYWFFWHAVNRMVERKPGYAYLMQLHLADWLKRHPLDDSLKRSTEMFWNSIRK